MAAEPEDVIAAAAVPPGDAGTLVEAAEARASEAEQELALLYRIDEKIHGLSKREAGLAQLVGQSGRFLATACSALLIPAKRIRISATHSSWKHVDRRHLEKYLAEGMLPKLKGQVQPVVFDIPAAAAFGDSGCQAMACPIVDRTGNVEGMLAQIARVDGEPFRAQHARFLSHMARQVQYLIERSFDSMTGLMNRAGFEAQLIEAARSLTGDDTHQLIHLDLDNLQLVNDTFGQHAGNEVIVRFAQIISGILPRNAVATRLNGDDFAVLLKHGTQDDALGVCRLVRSKCTALRYLEGDKSLQVTFSAGVAGVAAEGEEGESMTAARIACNKAKDHGRDRVEVYDEDDQSIVRRYDDMHLVAEIQKTLDLGKFELMAQPIVALAKEAEGIRYEVLLRMKDGAGNSVQTESLFSAAERYQLMPQIDRWVIAETLKKLGAQLPRDRTATFAINLSGQSLGDDGLLPFIEHEVAQSGISWDRLRFEVTESAAVANRVKAQTFIDTLRARGCRFALDDFGAGLSSFAYLKSFKVDTLKIDGSFIRDITTNRISESMAAAITQVARVMGLETVAEYVEDQEARALVARLGVDYVQGHAIGKPIPLDGVLAGLSAPHPSSSA